jgi:hypothetical protein
MLSVGMKLYDARGNEAIVNNIEDNSLQVTVIRRVEIKYNNGKEKEIQEQKKYTNCSINDLGIQLFFHKEDLYKDVESILSDPLYAFNKENIRRHSGEKHAKIMKKIRSEAPKILMSASEKEKLVKGYSSKEESYREEINFYNNNYKSQRYFVRIDLDTEYYMPRYEKYHKGHYYEKFYIGKNVKHKDFNCNIIDWRSEIGSLFYDKEIINITKNDVGVFNSEVMLKRSFKFSPLEFQNLYVIGTDLYEEGAMDPFLLEVLEENRSNHKIGDIIKSIQSNQNKIIREDPRKNIIVQGCAGSGKTMILLHRLSYLKFNNYLHDVSKVKIITPNYLFASFIGELSNTLELEEIEHITITDYYIRSIKKYIKDFGIKPSREKHKNAIKSIARSSDSEKLSVDRYEEYFSESFVEYIEEFYNNKVIEYKNNVDIESILKITYRIYESENIRDNQTNNEFFNYLYRLSSTELFRKNKELKQRLNECNNMIASIYTYLDLMAVYKYKITVLEKMLEKTRLGLDNLVFSKPDHDIIYNYIISDLLDLSVHLSKIIELFKPVNNRNRNLIDVGQKELEKIFSECINFINSGLMGLSIKHDIEDFDILTNYKKFLKESQDVCKSKIDIINGLRTKHINNLEEKIKQKDYISNLILKEYEINLLKQKGKQLLYKEEFIIEIWFQILSDLDKNSSKSLPKQDGNIVNVFILLNLLYLHYGPMISRDDFLFIDEGQDYSLTEYKLINNINNGQVIFNIYGDINQALNSERKIENWNDLICNLDGNYYELNENYRNTAQITELCNKEFGFNLRPIGLQGPKIEYINQWQIESVIDNILYRDSKIRIAIITKHDELSVSRLSKKYRKYRDNSIIIGSVKKVKGLEFDTVFVFPKNMNRNELYISYSRSLRKLYIINQN